MTEIINIFNGSMLFTVAARLLLATFLGGVIGFERGKHGRAAGFRTHIILCAGSALTALIGIYCYTVLGFNSDPMRTAGQVVSGIGFLGAGAIILKNETTITGLTTAAGMWTTAIIGIATGVGFYSGAIVCTALLFCTTSFFTMFEKARKTIVNVHAEIADASKTNAVIDYICKKCGGITDIQIQAPKANISGAVALSIVVDKNRADTADILKSVRDIDGVIFAVYR